MSAALALEQAFEPTSLDELPTPAPEAARQIFAILHGRDEVPS